jgi:hypothetical protein
MINIERQNMNKSEEFYANINVHSNVYNMFKENKMKVYKIRRKSDGLFSTGTINPKFTKRGKIWIEPHFMQNHIIMLIKQNKGNINTYFDCEYVEYELNETNNCHDIIQDWNDLK